MADKPYHLWEVLEPGESVVISLPIIDLLHVVERMARDHNKVFRLDGVPVHEGEIKSRATRIA